MACSRRWRGGRSVRERSYAIDATRKDETPPRKRHEEFHTDTLPQVASVQSSVAQSRENVSSVSDVSSLALSQDRAASRASFEALAPA